MKLTLSGHKIESRWKKGEVTKEQKIGKQTLSRAVRSMALDMNVLSMGEHEKK